MKCGEESPRSPYSNLGTSMSSIRFTNRLQVLLSFLSLLTLLSASQAAAAPDALAPQLGFPEIPVIDEDDVGNLTLVCPVGCQLASSTNHHGGQAEFCDCDGDGARDEGCQIWLRTRPRGEQLAICQPGCEEPGEQCVKVTSEFPSGPVQIHCECRGGNCADADETELFEEDGSDEGEGRD